MSTRCQIRFQNETTETRAQIYRHSDGHPETVLSNLQHLKRLIQAARAEHGAAFTAANFIFVDRLWKVERTFRESSEQFPQSVMEILEIDSWADKQPSPSYFRGHSIEDPSQGIHGDEEFLYLVEISEVRSADWKVRVAGSADFPRWGADDINRAFEVAEWKFESSLEDALSKLDQKP